MVQIWLGWNFGGLNFLELPYYWSQVAAVMVNEMQKSKGGPGTKTSQKIPLGGNKFREIRKGSLI